MQQERKHLLWNLADLKTLQGSSHLHFSPLCVFVQPFFERLVKRKWLTNTEPYEQIEALIKEAFKKYSKMDSPPYQVHTSKTSKWTADAGAAAHVLHLSPSCWCRRSTVEWWRSTSAQSWEAESSAPPWRWGRGWLVGLEMKATRSKSSSKTLWVLEVRGHRLKN